jgi:hypothetical protein
MFASASSPRVLSRARRRASSRRLGASPTPARVVDASLVDARLASSDDALETESPIVSIGVARASRVISRRIARRRHLRRDVRRRFGNHAASTPNLTTTRVGSGSIGGCADDEGE